MTRFITIQLLRNKILMAWPAMTLLCVLLLLWYGDAIISDQQEAAIQIGNLMLPQWQIVTSYITLIGLIVLISFPAFLIENLRPERASLLFSKPISRTQFFGSAFAGSMIVTVLYTIVTAGLVLIFFLVKGAGVPGTLLVGILALPLLVLPYFVTVLLLAIVTKNYLITFFLGYVITALSTFLLVAEELFIASGIESQLLFIAITTGNYVVPGVGPAYELLSIIVNPESITVDEGLNFTSISLHYLASMVPFTGLSYYLINKQEF
ncbi:hypothetical protein [Rhodohalobacter sp.]|uniref:hypothetical protein n=1 Tax=Rhodohalobacter sp. TaxID=1974210 RepID=UPI002ACEABA4|nr:hypothetical protein [Rhodohalobacter sp.]MDZ7758582.1 hypothetical protein [Rhodohalobacter sp.]